MYVAASAGFAKPSRPQASSCPHVRISLIVEPAWASTLTTPPPTEMPKLFSDPTSGIAGTSSGLLKSHASASTSVA